MGASWLIGTRGTIELDGDSLRCTGAEPDERRYDMPACWSQSYAAAITHFVDCLEKNAAFETAPGDNLRTLELVESAYSGWAPDSGRG